MIVVPKPNPLNFNRLGHSHLPPAHGYGSFGHSSSSMAPAVTASYGTTTQSKRARNSTGPASKNSPAPTHTRTLSTPPRSPNTNKQLHSHSRSNSRTNPSTLVSNPSPYSYSPSPNQYMGANDRPVYKQHRHANSGFASIQSANRFPFVVPGAGITFNPNAGPELEMALDLSDMSPPASPSPSSAHSRTPSPMSGASTPGPFTPTGAYNGPSANLFGVGGFFPSTQGPMSIPTRPSHARAPSAPALPFPHHHHAASYPHSHSVGSYSPAPISSFSFSERDRYANSGWQNSPPPAALPKPKFLDEDMF
jgi:hypothetical protein